MSSPSHRIALSTDAEEDFEEILLHTVRTWGVAQKDAYKASINRALRRLRDFPELGRTSDHLFLGCRALQVERHVVFYRLDGNTVRVVRILHERMDPAGRVKG